MKISLIKIFVSKSPFLYSYFKMSCEPEKWWGDSGLCTVMSHLRMEWHKGLSNDLLSKSHPCLLTNNCTKQVKKKPKRACALASCSRFEVLKKKNCAAWSQWTCHFPDALIVTFSKRYTRFYACSVPWHQCESSSQHTKSDSFLQTCTSAGASFTEHSFQLHSSYSGGYAFPHAEVCRVRLWRLFTLAVRGNGTVGRTNFHRPCSVPVKAARPVRPLGQDSASLTYPMAQQTPVTKEGLKNLVTAFYFWITLLPLGNSALYSFHLIFCYRFAQYLTGPFCLIWLPFLFSCTNFTLQKNIWPCDVYKLEFWLQRSVRCFPLLLSIVISTENMKQKVIVY